MKTICRNTQNECLYEHQHDDIWKNLSNGKTGEIKSAAAEKYLKIVPDAMTMCFKNENIKNLIEVLGLRIEKTNKTINK